MKQSMGILGNVQGRSVVGDRWRPFLAVVAFVTWFVSLVAFTLLVAGGSLREVVCESPSVKAVNRAWARCDPVSGPRGGF
jgi:hypothetical protein